MMQFMKHAHPLLCRPLKITKMIMVMSNDDHDDDDDDDDDDDGDDV